MRRYCHVKGARRRSSPVFLIQNVVLLSLSAGAENKHLLPADRKPGEEPESLVGKQVEYVTDNGLKRTGLVIYQVPAKPTVYYIKYDDDVHIHVYDLVKTT